MDLVVKAANVIVRVNVIELQSCTGLVPEGSRAIYLCQNGCLIKGLASI